jgi:hypothetical protein
VCVYGFGCVGVCMYVVCVCVLGCGNGAEACLGCGVLRCVRGGDGHGCGCSETRQLVHPESPTTLPFPIKKTNLQPLHNNVKTLPTWRTSKTQDLGAVGMYN